jgi:hypothetical protein
MPDQTNAMNVKKYTDQERLRCCSLVSEGLCRRTRDYLSAGVEMSTLARTSNAQFFYPRLKRCALHPDSRAPPVGPPIIQFVSLERE